MPCTVKADTTRSLTCRASRADPGAVLQTLVARHVRYAFVRSTMARPTSPSVSIARRRSSRRRSERTVLWVRGDHDIATKVSVAVGIVRAAECDETRVIVDLSGVTFMDASTVGAIVGTANRLRSRGQSLEVRAPSRPARRVLELCGLAHLIQQAPAHSHGAAAALATWVDVVPSEPPADIDQEDARIAALPTRRPTARALVAADGRVEPAVATAEEDRGGS